LQALPLAGTFLSDYFLVCRELVDGALSPFIFLKAINSALMDAYLLKSLGQILGVGGLALGIFFLLFREMIRKSIFPMLKRDDAYRLLRLISALIWSVAVIGVAAWFWGDRAAAARSVTTSGSQSPVVQDTKGDVRIDFNTSPSAPK
jgi:hypothetical protein